MAEKEPDTIKINMDKKCPSCGKKGVCESGYCMVCSVKRYSTGGTGRKDV